MRPRCPVYFLALVCLIFGAMYLRYLHKTSVKLKSLANELIGITTVSNQLGNDRRSSRDEDAETVESVVGYDLDKFSWVDQRAELSTVREFQKSNGAKKVIVWFDVHHNGHGLRNKARHVDFDKCVYKDCTLSLYSPDKDYTVTNPIKADALIFQMCHLYLWPVPPRRLSPDIPFILAEREGFLPMAKAKFDESGNYSLYKDIFNWTMTFRRDSDIFLPYGEFREKKRVNDMKSATTEKALTDTLRKVYKQKTKGAIWLVSHCETRSFREEYVKELKKFTDVDIFGRCGRAICRRGSTVQDRNCLENYIKDYKYVLNFENTFYTDYVTEKLFDWFPVDIIQVVYGSAKYSQFVPNGTLINTWDFDSPKALGEYLNRLGENEDVYVEFLSRKKKYYTVQHDAMQQRAYCNLCKRLHNIDRFRKSISHIGGWWEPGDVTKIANKFVFEPSRNDEFFNRMKNFRYSFTKRLNNSKFDFA